MYVLWGKRVILGTKNHPPRGLVRKFMFLTITHCSQTKFIQCEPEVLPAPQIPFPPTCASQTQQRGLEREKRELDSEVSHYGVVAFVFFRADFLRKGFVEFRALVAHHSGRCKD